MEGKLLRVASPALLNSPVSDKSSTRDSLFARRCLPQHSFRALSPRASKLAVRSLVRASATTVGGILYC